MSGREPTPTDTTNKLIESFESLIKASISVTGIWPLPLVVATPQGFKYRQLKVEDKVALSTFFRVCGHPDVSAAMVGLDRFDPEPEKHRTEFKDILTCVLFEHAEVSPLSIAPVRLRECFRYGIIEYHYHPRAQRPMEWTNKFWNDLMKYEVSAFIPDLVIGEDNRISMGSNMKRLVI